MDYLMIVERTRTTDILTITAYNDGQIAGMTSTECHKVLDVLNKVLYKYTAQILGPTKAQQILKVTIDTWYHSEDIDSLVRNMQKLLSPAQIEVVTYTDANH